MSPLQRVAVYFGLRKPDPTTAGSQDRPRDSRTLLQVLIGSAVAGTVAGLVWALFDGDTVSSITFGVLMALFFLAMDLRAQRQDRDRTPGG